MRLSAKLSEKDLDPEARAILAHIALQTKDLAKLIGDLRDPLLAATLSQSHKARVLGKFRRAPDNESIIKDRI